MTRPWTWLLPLLLVAAGLAWWLTRNAPEPAPEASSRAEGERPRDEAPPPGPLVRGQVVDRASGAGVPEALVEARCAGSAPIQAAADASGAFAFDALPPGSCALSASAPGWSPGGPTTGAPLTFEASADTVSGLEISLSRACRVAGRVVAGDAAVRDAHLTLLYLEAPGESDAWTIDPEASTSATGAFDIDGIPAGRLRVLVEHADYPLGESADVFLQPGDSREGLLVDLGGGGAATVAGVVRDSRGRPLRGVRVKLSAAERPIRAFTTDEEGRFEAPHVPPGEVTLEASLVGYSDGGARSELVAGDRWEVELTLESAGGLVGVVLDPRGRPAAEASVYVLHAPARRPDPNRMQPVTLTDERGRFWLQPPDAPDAVAFAAHPRYSLSAQVALAGGDPLTLELGEGGSIVGRVLGPDGTPLTQYVVAVDRLVVGTQGRRQRWKASGVQPVRVVDAEGRFRVLGLAPDTYRVSVRPQLHPPVRTDEVVVVSGREADVGTLRLEAGASIVGRIVDQATGAPLANASVRLPELARPGDVPGGPRSGTDAEGRFRVTGLSGELVSVHVNARGYLSRMRSGVRLDPGGEVDLGDIGLTRGAKGDESRMQYGGVGAVLRQREGRLLVQDLFDGAPAAQAGLVKGAEILAINGVSAGELDLRRAIELIRGEAGTELTLDVVFPGGAGPEEVVLERGTVTTPKKKPQPRRKRR